MAGKKREFTLEDGIYVFDRETCKRIYKTLMNYGRTHIVEDIAKSISEEHKTDLESERAKVKKWVQGLNGPSEIEDIKIMASVLGYDVHDLLILIRRKETKMNSNISEAERAVARGLYGELCDLIQDVDWYVPIELGSMEGLIEQEEARRRREFYEKYPDEHKPHFFDRKEAKEYYLQLIRKTSLDLPARMRENLRDLVIDCLTWTNYDESDGTYDLSVFGAPYYDDYLESSGLQDTTENQVKYIGIYRKKLEERLDEIYQDYIRI